MNETSPEALRHDLGLGDFTLLVIGAIVGDGIYVVAAMGRNRSVRHSSSPGSRPAEWPRRGMPVNLQTRLVRLPRGRLKSVPAHPIPTTQGNLLMAIRPSPNRLREVSPKREPPSAIGINAEKWHEWRDSNPRPAVLETAALPTELHSSVEPSIRNGRSGVKCGGAAVTHSRGRLCQSRIVLRADLETADYFLRDIDEELAAEDEDAEDGGRDDHDVDTEAPLALLVDIAQVEPEREFVEHQRGTDAEDDGHDLTRERSIATPRYPATSNSMMPNTR